MVPEDIKFGKSEKFLWHNLLSVIFSGRLTSDKVMEQFVLKKLEDNPKYIDHLAEQVIDFRKQLLDYVSNEIDSRTLVRGNDFIAIPYVNIFSKNWKEVYELRNIQAELERESNKNLVSYFLNNYKGRIIDTLV